MAHPDDAELLCAGTLARAKADGAAIGIAVLCRGDKGQPDPPIEDLGKVRGGEMRAAAELLGAEFTTAIGDWQALARTISRTASRPALLSELSQRGFDRAQEFRQASLRTRRILFYRALRDLASDDGGLSGCSQP